jgi:trans-aconitate 2-methyltransferase
MSWSAVVYSKFERDRSRAVEDLLARVPTPTVAAAADLGCGPGNSTELLMGRYPEATIIGLDSSPDMIAAARRRLPGVRFEIGDIGAWQPHVGQFDVILANAVLQWLPNHASLLPALLGRLAPGGTLAVQIPDTFEEPAHRLMRDIAGAGAWSGKLARATHGREVRRGADWYWEILHRGGARVDMWRTTYYHVLDGADAIVAWFQGSGLRPFLDPLDPAERATFLLRYRTGIGAAYPAHADGKVLLPFPRLFFIATLA